MRYALIDNSSLTAAQRLLGQVAVKNLYQIDGDVAAFEGLIQAILFYDKICCIDDYKQEFRKQRNQFFDFILPIGRRDFAYDEFLAAAREATRDVILRVESGSISNKDFSEFLDTLRMNTVFTWRMQSSQFFLTMNMLADGNELTLEKYSALSQMIFSQLAAKDVTDDSLRIGSACQIVDSSGRRVNRGFRTDRAEYKVGPQVWAFAASLNWLALRTAFYSFAAQSSGMEAVLHPIRHAFRLHFAHTKMGMPDAVFQPVLGMLRGGIRETVDDILEVSDPIISRVDLPIFTAYLASRTKDPHRFIAEAHQLRTQPPISQARQRLIELEDLVDSGNRRSFVTETNRLRREIRRTAARLRGEYGVDAPQGIPAAAFTWILNVPLQIKAGLSLPDFGLKIPLPRMALRLADRRSFKATFRGIVEELVSIERLGGLHDVITSAVVRDEGAAYYDAQREEARYRGRNSAIKRWM